MQDQVREKKDQERIKPNPGNKLRSKRKYHE